MRQRAWLVITERGFEAAFLDLARAERYAADSHGQIEHLFALNRAQLEWLQRMPPEPPCATPPSSQS